jgi:hypothetical protein
MLLFSHLGLKAQITESKLQNQKARLDSVVANSVRLINDNKNRIDVKSLPIVIMKKGQVLNGNFHGAMQFDLNRGYWAVLQRKKVKDF